MKTVLERFLEYAKVSTGSVSGRAEVPSTPEQFDLARKLAAEMTEMGLSDVYLDEEHCYVYAKLPSNVDYDVPRIGFISHMDTSEAVCNRDVKPIIHKNYDGGDIILNKEQNIVLSPEEYPVLKRYIGKDIVTSDGTTLLGADDKAGIAEILTACEYLLAHPEIPHGTLCIAFTPDEEVGHGVSYFDLKRFDADFGYTVDGGEIGTMEYENFNGASFKLDVYGKSIHPGSAKGKMVNALLLINEFISMLPANETPATTELYEGFYHIKGLKGDVEHAQANYIIRDHSFEIFDKRKALVMNIVDFLNKKYGEGTFQISMKDGYKNMRGKIEPHMHLMDNAQEAMRMAGEEPRIILIRGGGDGARLSYMGLPCPNVCTGGHNFHGRFEYIPVQSMETMTQWILNVAKLYAEKK